MSINEQALEAAAKALFESTRTDYMTWEHAMEETRALRRSRMLKNVTAYLEHLPSEYAGKHKHAGLELTDEEGESFIDEQHVRENYAEYGNCTIMTRRVTEWEPLDTGGTP